MKYEQAYVLAITHFIESRQLYGLPCIMCGIGRPLYFAAVLSFCKTEQESNETLPHARNEPDLKMVVKNLGSHPFKRGAQTACFPVRLSTTSRLKREYLRKKGAIDKRKKMNG